jgi:hypothetical protein
MFLRPQGEFVQVHAPRLGLNSIAVDPAVGAAQVIALVALHCGIGGGQAKKIMVQEGNAQGPNKGSGSMMHMDASSKYTPGIQTRAYKRVVITTTNTPRHDAPTFFFMVYCKNYMTGISSPTTCLPGACPEGKLGTTPVPMRSSYVLLKANQQVLLIDVIVPVLLGPITRGPPSPFLNRGGRRAEGCPWRKDRSN